MRFLHATLVIAALGFGLAYAGDDKSPIVMAPTDPVGFAPGFEVGGFVAGAFPDSDLDSELGGGVSLAYFFTDNVGIDLSYAVFAFESEIHTMSADLALRYPLSGTGISPYLLLGSGLKTNGSTDAIYRVGGGLDFRPNGPESLGIFADGVYNWVEGEDGFTIARFGVRFPL